MPPTLLVAVAIGIFGITALPCSRFRGATVQLRATEADMPITQIQIPQSVQAEHETIHAALVEATHAPGRVGTAAKELAQVLHPHFVREEQIALPPLGLLAPLAAGARPPGMAEALAMTDSLRRELPGMLDEHERIRAAVANLRLAARAEHAEKYERLADQLALHAQTEEEVLYPAAVLVGDVIRARLQSK
jgi:hypothetical protein